MLICLFGFAEKVVSAKTTFSAELFRHGSQHFLAITLTPEADWHTYWENPGEAGLPLKVSLSTETISKGVIADPSPFPIPQRYELGGVVMYGYGESKTFFTKLKLKSGKLPQTLAGTATWLTCDDTECLVGEASFSLDTVVTDKKRNKELDEMLHSLPRRTLPYFTKYWAEKEGETVTLKIDSTAFQKWNKRRLDLSKARVFPLSESLSEIGEETYFNLNGTIYEAQLKLSGDQEEKVQVLVVPEQSKAMKVEFKIK